jgi:hypothetical protein
MGPNRVDKGRVGRRSSGGNKSFMMKHYDTSVTCALWKEWIRDTVRVAQLVFLVHKSTSSQNIIEVVSREGGRFFHFSLAFTVVLKKSQDRNSFSM